MFVFVRNIVIDREILRLVVVMNEFYIFIRFWDDI